MATEITKKYSFHVFTRNCFLRSSVIFRPEKKIGEGHTNNKHKKEGKKRKNRMRSGISGFVERSRVDTATTRRVPSIVYTNSGGGPGSGAIQPSDDVDPVKQAERFVARVAGASEAQWANRRMQTFHAHREMKLQVANFRHRLLKKAVAAAQYEKGALAQARDSNLIGTATATMLSSCRGEDNISSSSNSNNNTSSGGSTRNDDRIPLTSASSAAAAASHADRVLQRFLQQFASPEQLQMILPDDALRAVEERVMQLKQSLAEQYAAQLE